MGDERNKNQSTLPWVIGGDFNITRFVFERQEGLDNLKNIDNCNDLVRETDLIDFPLSGRKFTWSNKRHVLSS